MTRRRAQVTVLCEDSQHEAFALRFLAADGWENDKIRVARCPAGAQSAEQWVRERFAAELKAYRAKRGSVARKLIVLVDADRWGEGQRLGQLQEVCREKGVPPRTEVDDVAIFVPARNIETWLAYLDGASVDEKTEYRKLERPRECGRHVRVLQGMCQERQLRRPAPPSLESACAVYRQRLTP